LTFHLRREADDSPPSSAEEKEWVELYLHSPNTPSWRGAQLGGAHLPFTVYLINCNNRTFDSFHQIRIILDRTYSNLTHELYASSALICSRMVHTSLHVGLFEYISIFLSKSTG
jgi:hypothetical protein